MEDYHQTQHLRARILEPDPVVNCGYLEESRAASLLNSLTLKTTRPVQEGCLTHHLATTADSARLTFQHIPYHTGNSLGLPPRRRLLRITSSIPSAASATRQHLNTTLLHPLQLPGTWKQFCSLTRCRSSSPQHSSATLGMDSHLRLTFILNSQALPARLFRLQTTFGSPPTPCLHAALCKATSQR
jgi:hypothetical protein